MLWYHVALGFLVLRFFSCLNSIIDQPNTRVALWMRGCLRWTFRCIRYPCIISPPLTLSCSVFTSDAEQVDSSLLWLPLFILCCFVLPWFHGCFMFSLSVLNACFFKPCITFGLLKWNLHEMLFFPDFSFGSSAKICVFNPPNSKCG